MKTKFYTQKTKMLILVVGLLTTVVLFAETTLSGDYDVTGKLRGGNTAVNPGTNSCAIGIASNATGYQSAAFGPNAKTSGCLTVSVGQDTIAAGNYSAAFGQYSQSNGTGSTSLGYSPSANGNYSLALGYNTTSTADYSFTLGANVTSASYECLVIGQFNKAQTGQSNTTWSSTDDLFVIGNGTSATTLSSALVVSKNGNVTINKRQGDIIMGSFGNGGGD